MFMCLNFDKLLCFVVDSVSLDITPVAEKKLVDSVSRALS